MSRVESKVLQARRLCHQLFFSSCVDEKRQGCHEALLRQRPHWSVLKKEEQMEKIDQGERIPFDITLPLPARDERSGSDSGVNLFWELFSCQRCGRCYDMEKTNVIDRMDLQGYRYDNIEARAFIRKTTDRFDHDMLKKTAEYKRPVKIGE